MLCLPNGGMIVGIVIGAIIILVGLGSFLQVTYGTTIDFWPIIIIVFGLLIVLGAVFRRRRYSEHPSNP